MGKFAPIGHKQVTVRKILTVFTRDQSTASLAVVPLLQSGMSHFFLIGVTRKMMRFTRRRLITLAGLGAMGAAIGSRGLSNAKENPAATRPIAPTLPNPGLTVPPDALVLRFAATADSGAGDRNQRLVGQAMADYHAQNPYDLTVMAGDNIYNSGEMSRIGVAFEQPYETVLKRGVKFRACLGNHDVRTNNGDPQVKYAGFNMDDRYYSYSLPGADFFVLETNVDVDWKAQLNWLEQQLKKSIAAVKIVYGHHPIYASGVYGTDIEMVKRLTPLFKKYQVNLYINGHEHHYERTASIDGTTYLVTGHGGASLRPVGKSKFTEFSLSTHGFSAIEIYQGAITIQGIDKTGKVFDRATVPLVAA
jgi:3',5'-cyclic AMP phosphodiesterase CpdA